MSDPLPDLPASFERAHGTDASTDLVTGTITEVGTYPHFERGMMNVFVTLTLDPNKFGAETARAFITPGTSNLIGRRVRGKLMFDEKDYRDLTKHGVPGYNWKYSMMMHNPGVYYDVRTTFLDADDPTLKATGDVTHENLKVFGITHIDTDYYRAHGYDFSKRPHIDGNAQSQTNAEEYEWARPNAFLKFLGRINLFNRPTATNNPQLEHRP